MLFSGQCGQQCTSTSCLLAEEEQKEVMRQKTDIQSTRHVLVCLLLTVGLLAVSTASLIHSHSYTFKVSFFITQKQLF